VAQKNLSQVVVPESVLNSYKPALSRSWDLAVAGWAVAIWLFTIGSFIENLAIYPFKYAVVQSFISAPIIFGVGALTVVVTTAVARFRGNWGDGGDSPLLSSGFVLYALYGALAVALGVVGFIFSFTVDGGSNKLFFLVQNVSGVILGGVVIVWALGELKALNASGPAVPGGPAALGQIETRLEGMVPAQAMSRPELARSWELVVMGWAVGVCVYAVSTLFTESAVPLLAGTVATLLLAAPISVVAVTAVVRLRGPFADSNGRFAIDLAILLTVILAPVLAVLSVIAFFKSFSGSAGTVIANLLGVATGLVMAVLLLVWALGELAVLRRSGTSSTAAVVTPAPTATPVPAPPAEPPAAPIPEA
jgi:hypothetical protein